MDKKWVAVVAVLLLISAFAGHRLPLPRSGGDDHEALKQQVEQLRSGFEERVKQFNGTEGRLEQLSASLAVLTASSAEREALKQQVEKLRSELGERVKQLGDVEGRLRQLSGSLAAPAPTPAGVLANGSAALWEEVKGVKKRLLRSEHQLREIHMLVPNPNPKGVIRRISSAEYLRDYAIAKALRNNITTSGAGGEPTAAEQAKKPLCAHVSDVFPGRPVNVSGDAGYTKRFNEEFLQWRPDGGCRQHELTWKELGPCLKEKKVVMMGDSLMREAEFGLRGIGAPWKMFPRPEAGPYDTAISTGWSVDGDSVRFYFTRTGVEPPNYPAWDYNNLEESVAKASVLFVHHGLHDIGMFCKGSLWRQIDGLQKRVAALRKTSPGARIIFVGLRWLYPQRALVRYPGEEPGSVSSYYYNTLLRTRAYRTSLRAAAACAGVEYIPMEDLHKRLPLLSYDGLHHGMESGLLYTDLLFGTVCPRGGGPPLKTMTGKEIGDCAELTRKANKLAAEQETGDQCLSWNGTEDAQWVLNANGTVPQFVLDKEKKASAPGKR